MAYPMGKVERRPVRVDFDRRIKLEFHGARITTDGGLLAYRELDDALGRTDGAMTKLLDGRRGRNTRHKLGGLFRQSVFGRLAGYEDVNDAERLARDPAMAAVREHPKADRPAAAKAAPRMSWGCFDDRISAGEVRPESHKLPPNQAERRLALPRERCAQSSADLACHWGLPHPPPGGILAANRRYLGNVGYTQAGQMEYLLTLATDPTAWVALATLIVMEVVLGIDNLIFISILTNKLPEHQRSNARRVGIAAALILRLGLLSTVAVIVQMTSPVFTIFDNAFSWRDLILIAGGLFLVWKSTMEIHHSVDPDPGPDLLNPTVSAGFVAVVGQILILDLVFSIDSIITAVGMTEHIPIMVIAVVVAVGVMLLAANPLAIFIHANPTIVMLALGFLLLIGTMLIADGFGVHVPKGYIYAAMAFSALIEGLNMLSRRARQRRAEAASTDQAMKS